MSQLSELLRTLILGTIGDPASSQEMIDAVTAGANAIPDQTGQTGKFLSTNGTETIWAPGDGAGTVTSVATGTGLTGGPITASGTISLANTTVTPNSYTSANITVDAQGRITAASDGGTSAVGADNTIQLSDGSGGFKAAPMRITSGTLVFNTGTNDKLQSSGGEDLNLASDGANVNAQAITGYLRLFSPQNGITHTATGLQFDGGDNGHLQINSPITYTSYSLTLPAAQGTGALANNGSGSLSWAAMIQGAASLTTTGAVPYVSSSGTLAQSAMTYDNTNIRLNIGASTLTGPLNILSTDNVAGNSFIYNESVTAGINGNGIAFRRATGTPSSKAAVAVNTGLGALTANGHDGTNYSAAGTGLVGFFANENFSSTSNHGTGFIVQTTPNGQNSRRISMIQTPGSTQFYEVTGVNKLTLNVPSSITSYTLTYPNAQGAVDQTLRNNGSGTLTWQNFISSLTGDVTSSGAGSSVSTTVTKLQNVSVASTTPTNGQVLTYNLGSTQWEPQTPSGGGLPSSFIASNTGYAGTYPLLAVDSSAAATWYFGTTGVTSDAVTAGMNISTGENTDIAGTASTGYINFGTGSVTGTNKSGDIYIINGTANSATATSGNLYLNVETDQGTPGYTFLGSHEATSSTIKGGAILIEPGPSDHADGQDVTILSGGTYDSSNYGSGNIIIKVLGGQTSDPLEALFWDISDTPQKTTGDIRLIVEAGTSSSGNIQMQPADGSAATATGKVWTATDNNGSGTWSNGVVEYTKTYSDFSTAGNTNSITLFSLPAGTILDKVIIKHSAAFTGGTTSAYTLSVGIAGNNFKYASAFDVFQAPGDTIFQLSSSANIENFSSPTNITITATSTGDTLDHATAGSVTIYIITKGVL